jgi:hypothetical protein
VFQTEGRLRLEFGPGGTEPNEAIVFRVGEGEVLVNLDDP